MNKCLSSWLLLLHSGLTITTILNAGIVKAQITNSDSEQLPPQDVIPPTPQPLPVPDTNPSPPPPPEDVLPSPQTPTPSDKLPATETITVTEFEFVGNTVLTSVQLNQRLKNKFIQQTLPKTFSLTQLLEIASDIAAFYAEKGYSTSGAIISIPQITRDRQEGIVRIKVIEGNGTLVKLKVSGCKDLKIREIK